MKRDQEDDINEEIRSRVLYGSNKGSGNGGESSKGLPPELEGDERLRNIEPRMVELIMNEVHDLVFLPSHYPVYDCSLASFPGPAQLFVACSTEKRGEPGIFSHVNMT